VPTRDTAPTLHSIPTAEGIADLVRRRYDMDVAACVLVRSFVNEVYEVRTPRRRRFVLKLYRHDGWTVDEVSWEAELVDHLVANSIPVAPVVSMTSDQAVGQLAAPEGVRPFLLSEYVEGRKPEKPFDDDLYRSYGRLIARIHEAGDTFRTDQYRRPFGLVARLDEPLARVLAALTHQPENQRLVEDLGVAARQRLTELADQMDWGVSHGDVTMDNVHRTDTGLVIHDFDLAHVGWRVADLTNCLATPFADAFLTGYTEIRAVGTADTEALPWLRVVESIRNLAFHLTDKAAWRGTESLGEGWVENGLVDLRVSADQLL
jgi:Ser/Thr protein kinase RdoA (MazF antagonist)